MKKEEQKVKKEEWKGMEGGNCHILQNLRNSGRNDWELPQCLIK
jgi:hypothetical protein